MNMPLKIAILESKKPQLEIARRAGMAEARLSRIIHERDNPREDEKKALAKALRRDVEDLFPQVAA